MFDKDVFEEYKKPFIGIGSIILLAVGTFSLFTERQGPNSQLELKPVDGYSTNLNNDRIPDLIKKKDGNYYGYVGLDDGSYRPYELSKAQIKSLEENESNKKSLVSRLDD